MPFELTLDNVIAKVNNASRIAGDKTLRKLRPTLYSKMKDVETASAKLRRREPVVDDVSYQETVPLLDDLSAACVAAQGEIDALLTKPKLTQALAAGSLSDAADKLKALREEVATLIDRTKKQIAALAKWHKDYVVKKGDFSVTIDGKDTDLIGKVDKDCAITMPDHQRFKAEIIVDKVPQFMLAEFESKRGRVEAAFKRLLPGFQEETKRRFDRWNKDFARFKLEHDESGAKSLFQSINRYFETEAPKMIQDAFDKIDVLSEVLNKVQIRAFTSGSGTIKREYDFDGFAEFVVNLPELREDDAAGGLAENLEDVLADLEDVDDDYHGAVRKIFAQLNRSGESDIKKIAKDAAKALSTLMTDLGSANKAIVKMVREVRSSKDGPVDKHQLQGLQGAINPVLRFLKDTASKKLAGLESNGKAPGLTEADLYDKKLFDELSSVTKALQSKLPKA